MATRIPQAFLDQLLSRIDIVDIIDRLVPLKKSGHNYTALCPFHAEKTPSFSVSQSKQFYHCFGCSAGGNAISFLMEYERLSFMEAVESLAKTVGLEIPHTLQQAPALHLELYDLLSTAHQYYQEQLKRSPMAIQYLKNRGITGETAKKFGLGFATDAWQQIQSFAPLARCIAAGLVIQNDEGKTYDRFRERIMFPIRDRRGRIIGFGGRVLNDSLPKYLNSPETSLFQKSHELYGLYEARAAQRELKTLFIVEGYMDVISLAQAGITHVVATLGTATSTTHIQTLLRHAPTIIFCFDGDRAGRAAAWRALEIALPIVTDNVAIRFMFLEEKEDPDSFVRRHGKEAFLKKSQSALSLVDYFFTELSHDLDLSRSDNRVQLADKAKHYLQALPENLLRDVLHEELHKRTRLSIAAPHKKKQRILRHTSTKKPSTMRAAIMLLIQYPKLARLCPVHPTFDQLPGGRLLLEIHTLLSEKPDLSTAALLEHFRESDMIKQILQLAAIEHGIPETGVEAELQDAIKRLHGQLCDAKIEGLLAKAAQEGLSADEKSALQTLIQTKGKNLVLT